MQNNAVSIKKRSRLCFILMLVVLLICTIFFVIQFSRVTKLNIERDNLYQEGADQVVLEQAETRVKRAETVITIGAIVGLNLFLAMALLTFIFSRAAHKGTKESQFLKTSMQICLISMVAIFIAGAVSLGIRFTALNAKYSRYTQMLQQGVGSTDVRATLLAEEIKHEESLIFFFAILLATLVVADSVIAFFFARAHVGQTRAMVYKMAYEDEVTGLPTKAKHRIDLEKFFSRPRAPRAYVSLEIYNFKYINEMYGYSFGNYVLKYVADEISKTLKSDELFARTGGAHFGLLLRYDNDEALVDRLNGWFTSISKIRSSERANVVNIQFTSGVYRITDKDDDPGRAREFANVARESATHHFDNTIEFYDSKMQEQLAVQAELELDSSKALEDGEFKVFLQPKYSTTNEKIVGAEALIRWKHHKRGLIGPNDFIPIFESNGFIVKIDFYVLEEVCKCIKKWMEDGLEPVIVSVNLSRVHLYDTNLVDEIVKMVDSYGIPHEYIEFELTETVLFEELDALISVMNKLKAAGFILSMDDFGSGYSSLNMLKQLPVDVLKLDKGFMDNFQSDEPDSRDKAIISHVIHMAKDLNMEVLAEGVETENQQKFLKESECDMIQGYYYSKPVSLSEFDTLFRNSL